MKLSRLLIFMLVFVSPLGAYAQMEIDDLAGGDKVPVVSFADSIRIQKFEVDFYSHPRYRHERMLVRKERNNLEITGALQGSLTNLNESWIETSGGDNTVTLLASLYLKHTYTKNLFSLLTNVSCKFGYYRVMLDETLDSGEIESVPVWFKNQDEFQIDVTPSYKMTKNWSYGATVKFRSQFAQGYVSSGSQNSYNLKSDFMSPGYLDLSGGLIYVCPKPKFPITISISPIAMSAIYVKSAEIRENAQYSYADPSVTAEAYVEPYGIDPYTSSKYEGGSSLQLNFDKSFGKDGFIRYVTTLYSFYGWMSQVTHDNVYGGIKEYELALDEWSTNSEGVKPMLSIHPTCRWENRIVIKASKLISTTLDFQLYYNRAQNLSVQTQTLLSVGVSYKFTNR